MSKARLQMEEAWIGEISSKRSEICLSKDTFDADSNHNIVNLISYTDSTRHPLVQHHSLVFLFRPKLFITPSFSFRNPSITFWLGYYSIFKVLPRTSYITSSNFENFFSNRRSTILVYYLLAKDSTDSSTIFQMIVFISFISLRNSNAVAFFYSYPKSSSFKSANSSVYFLTNDVYNSSICLATDSVTA